AAPASINSAKKRCFPASARREWTATSEVVFVPQPTTKGIDVIRSMKSLTKINFLAPDEFWKKYDAGEFK
ncbi:MAG: hypothetical protein K2R98_00245, partial [Gemmataceae bacterium]|nr:hypothetical protein [Gemmataceae bacterium]